MPAHVLARAHQSEHADTPAAPTPALPLCILCNVPCERRNHRVPVSLTSRCSRPLTRGACPGISILAPKSLGAPLGILPGSAATIRGARAGVHSRTQIHVAEVCEGPPLVTCPKCRDPNCATKQVRAPTTSPRRHRPPFLEAIARCLAKPAGRDLSTRHPPPPRPC